MLGIFLNWGGPNAKAVVKTSPVPLGSTANLDTIKVSRRRPPHYFPDGGGDEILHHGLSMTFHLPFASLHFSSPSLSPPRRQSESEKATSKFGGGWALPSHLLTLQSPSSIWG